MQPNCESILRRRIAPLLFSLTPVLVAGCGGEPANAPTENAVGAASSSNDSRDYSHHKLLKDAPFLAPPELQAEFYNTSFAWTNGPANWDYMTQEQRSQALLGGGLTRNQYNDNSVQIKEAYYDPQTIMRRWQEELRNGQWVRHGPEVVYDQDGRYEIMFRIDGELEGPRIYVDANGQETSRKLYEGGIPVE